jgi:hemolysin activation/secretion protein
MKMHRFLLLAALAAPAPGQVTPSPGSDAATVLGRDTVPTNEAEMGKRVQATAPTAVLAPEPVATVDPGQVQIGAIFVDGLSALSQADFADIAESYAGQTLDNEGLRALARQIADRARSKGYIFASAAIPAQQLNIGVLRVTLDEGRIDEVRITGGRNRRVKELLESLRGPSVRKEVVERRLLLATDVPGIEIPATRYQRENGKGVLIVELKHRRTQGRAVLDNYGDPSFGPVRLRLETELAGLLDSDDALASYVTATPAQPRELTYVAHRYANVLTKNGLELALTASAGRTRNSDRASSFGSSGRSRSGAAALSAPLLRAGAGSLWVSGEFAYLNVVQDFFGFGIQRDDIATATITAWGNVRVGKSRIRGGVALTRGLDVLGATEANDPRASRPDASGRFTKANAWVNWTGSIAKKTSLRLAASGQIANGPLLSPQEIGIGGPGFGRGYDFSERSGDDGVLGSAELRQNFDAPAKWLGWAQLYGFVDGGHVGNLQRGFGGGTLLSGGGGIRAGKGNAEFGLEVAAPINADRFETQDRSPKVNLIVSYGF